MTELPYWLPRGQRVSFQSDFKESVIYGWQKMHTRGSILACKLRADMSRSPNHWYQWPYKRINVFQKVLQTEKKKKVLHVLYVIISFTTIKRVSHPKYWPANLGVNGAPYSKVACVRTSFCVPHIFNVFVCRRNTRWFVYLLNTNKHYFLFWSHYPWRSLTNRKQLIWTDPDHWRQMAHVTIFQWSLEI